MTNKPWKIPYRISDSQPIQDTYWAIHNCDSNDIIWKDVIEFDTILYTQNYYRGRSASGLTLSDSNGICYDINIKNFMEVLHRRTINNGYIEKTKWTFTKQGTAISLKLA